MQKQKFSREEFLEMFKQDVIRLSKYIPWLEEKSGADVSKYYKDGEKMAHTLSFPVYDSILLAFLNDASTTVFMEQNYQYFYTRKHIQSYEDELALIEKADIMHMDILQCILSRYVFGGMVKAYLWKDGVEHRIFVNILKKARQIVEFWSEPLIIEDEIPAEGYPEEEEFTYPEVDEADWTDEEFAAVLAGELDPNDIPRLRWKKSMVRRRLLRERLPQIFPKLYCLLIMNFRRLMMRIGRMKNFRQCLQGNLIRMIFLNFIMREKMGL